ncbi:hypothetical protein IDH50_12855 [Aeromicrobium tamlense]|uniref:LuxR family maltose regulon positive regulatory protein n=1 Tax=Aeromicrobium tamlense TaxID=375541 RepID=A0A8I0FV45_9ACTN|nr:LuxR C-terminal-related transcriptional regulator [Aeromicrobium tamlense]MBD1270741.1 hypothetical protein [Aeromicrobium tamlense]MBD1271127.1 hypothetical protein [Aeromicrobium tamlense]NYI38133.1 LuxR family maltose regulon positive regulatory protein [Aeromicrobium tamlense]
MPSSSGRGTPMGPIGREMTRRDRILRRLDAIMELPAFVVCAGAGSGKTLAVASWCRDRDDFDLAWQNVGSLSPGPASFWSELVATIADAVGEGPTLDNLSPVLAMNAPELVAERLKRWAASRTRPLVVVLDDFHAITDLALLEDLQRLISSAPPSLHFVMISRHDPPWPLHRMRLEGSIADLRGAELAFTSAEAEELFALVGLGIDAEDVADLVLRTGGWAAGLRLAALHLRLAANRDDALKSISGRSEYIADYLMREVYDELPESWRSFLTKISIVDRISADLARALGASAEAGALLEQLARSHTFVHEIGREPGWYRLHPLLLDFLRSRVTDRPQSQELHRLAARWFDDQGRPWTALLHALDASDHEFAGELIGRHVVTWSVLRPPRELERVLSALTPSELRSDVGLVIGLAAARAMAGRLDDVGELLAQAHSLVDLDTGRRRARYEFLLDVIDVGTARWRGDLVRLAGGLEQVPVDAATLSQLGLEDWPTMQALVINNTGAAQLWLGDLTAARDRLEQIARRDPGDSLELPVLNARAHLAYLEWTEGNLSEAAELASSVIERFAEAGLSDAVQAACAHLAMAGVALDRNQTALADSWLDTAEAALHEPHVQLAAIVLRARTLQAQGQGYEGGRIVRDTLADLGDSGLPTRLREQAEETAARLTAGVDASPSVSDHTTRHHLLEKIRNTAETGDLDAMEGALDLAAPHDFRLPFLQDDSLRGVLLRRVETGTAHPEFASELLSDIARVSSDSRKGQLRGHSQLTQTEATVLRYLATPMSTAEIAKALFVSVNTVKTHQRAIHQKFGVTTRRDAVAMARSNDLL